MTARAWILTIALGLGAWSALPSAAHAQVIQATLNASGYVCSASYSKNNYRGASGSLSFKVHAQPNCAGALIGWFTMYSANPVQDTAKNFLYSMYFTSAELLAFHAEINHAIVNAMKLNITYARIGPAGNYDFAVDTILFSW